jgi:hypothetical protein
VLASVRRMDARTLARAQAAGRAAIGAALTIAPRATAAGWLGRDARRPATQVAIRALGARDLAIGLGVGYAASQGHGARPWLQAGTLADVVDLVATLRAREHLSPLGVAGVGAMAAGSAVLGLWLSRELD